MRRCNRCNVSITDQTEVCPLCGGVLDVETEPGVNAYPNVFAGKRMLVFFKRLMVFLSFVSIVMCVYINFHIPHHIWWSVIVTADLIYVIWMIYLITDPDAGYRKRAIVGIFGAAACVLLTDIMTGYRGWSVNYVFPGVIFFINVGLLILMIINRRSWQSYMIYQIGVILIAAVLVGLIYAGIVTVPMLSELAFVSCVFLFVGTLIFGGRVARTELARRFHI